MAEWFVPEDQLQAVTGKLLFHPCSGNDWRSSYNRFASCAREFWFSDPVYRRPPATGVATTKFTSDDAIAVLERFEPRSIGVFVHTGDSVGEGGSNLWFLSERPERGEYQPAGHFARLGQKLADRALIATDGSNSDIPRVSLNYFSQTANAEETFRSEKARGPFQFGGFQWSCVGFLPPNNGPVLLWSVGRTGSV